MTTKRERQTKLKHRPPTGAEDDPFSSQEKLKYLRGKPGERDRNTLWRNGRGTLPGTGEGGLVEGWLNNG